MITSKYFNFSRFGLVLKHDFMESWKSHLYRFIGIYALFLVFMLFGGKIAMSIDTFSENFFKVSSGEISKSLSLSSNIAFLLYCSAIYNLFTLILLVGGLIYASTILQPMSTRQTCISYLMLPATMLEKFVSRALFVTVGFGVLMALALLLAEMTRFLFIPFLDVPEHLQRSILPAILDGSIHSDELDKLLMDNGILKPQSSLEKMCALLKDLWVHSLFILGGVYWQRRPFFKTLGVLLVCYIFGFMGILSLNLEAVFQESGMDEGVAWVVVLWVLLLFTWWLSYKLFTRKQVVKPKLRSK